jgi:hypothetical protein
MYAVFECGFVRSVVCIPGGVGGRGEEKSRVESRTDAPGLG